MFQAKTTNDAALV